MRSTKTWTSSSFHPLSQAANPWHRALNLFSGWCWIFLKVPCFCAVTNPLNLLRNPANHCPSDLPSNQQNQRSKYSSEPRFVLQIACITTQEPRDGPWHSLDLVPQYNEHVHRCKVIVVIRNGQVAEEWSKISVCSPFVSKISSVYLRLIVLLLPCTLWSTAGMSYLHWPGSHYIYIIL
jgi:hypothetical protein